MADQGTVVPQSKQARHCSPHTAGLESTIVAVHLDAVELDCKLLLVAQTAAGLQTMAGSEAALRTKVGSAVEEAWIPLCWYAVRLVDH